MQDIYASLFPFERIAPHSRIVIYGAGDLGQIYLRQITITNYCKIVGILDKNYSYFENTGLNVLPPESIVKLDFDYVVLAVKGKMYLPEMYHVLEACNVPYEKIIHVGTRMNADSRAINCAESSNSHSLTCKRADLSMAVNIMSGIGGMIFIKRWLAGLLDLVRIPHVALFCRNNFEFAKYLFADIVAKENVLFNGDASYEHNMQCYDLAMTASGSGMISIDWFQEESISSKSELLADKIRKLQCNLKYEEVVIGETNRKAFFEACRFWGKNAYTAFEHSMLNLSNIQVSIPLTKDAHKQFETLNIGQYITVNSSNGSSNDATRIAKSWPLEHFNECIALFKDEYPEIKVVQLGAKESKKIPTADVYSFGEKFELVSQILKHSLFHLDIEGGLVHIASQLGTKCIVLFGPTPEFYYGYDTNINIKVSDCHDCCGIYSDHNRCARNLEKPSCMYDITPELVMKHINEYMQCR